MVTREAQATTDLLPVPGKVRLSKLPKPQPACSTLFPWIQLSVPHGIYWHTSYGVLRVCYFTLRATSTVGCAKCSGGVVNGLNSMTAIQIFYYLSDPDDFHGVVGTLSFTRNTTESCVTISVVDDSVRESVPECFTVSLVNVTGADIDGPSIATVCIDDNDGN